jgi:hypothetical protein
MLEQSLLSTHSNRASITTDLPVAIALHKPASQPIEHHSQSTFHMWYTKHHSFLCSERTSTVKEKETDYCLRR